MGKAIFNPNGFSRGFAKLPPYGNGTASVREAVHDGDTVTVAAAGDFSIRFLGIDTPEMTFQFPRIGDPNDGIWRSVADFKDYLKNPFSSNYPSSQQFKSSLGYGLLSYLQPKLTSQTASNHRNHADKAHRELEHLIQLDKDERDNQGEPFRFFMAFAYEIMDGNGRFLCFLDRENKPHELEGRLTYNERMLESGYATPYFIWPNVNPFRRKRSLIGAVPPPAQFQNWVSNDQRLSQARQFVRNARNARIGIFDASDPLVLLPFELRFLARREMPTRYIMNLSAANPVLLKPTEYHQIANIEDRLFIDKHFVPLFEQKGYTVHS
jgi:endonuclease YncB( thermonuclease family)